MFRNYLTLVTWGIVLQNVDGQTVPEINLDLWNMSNCEQWEKSFPNKRLVILFSCFDLLYHMKEYCKFFKIPCYGMDFKVLKAHSLKFKSTKATRRSIHEQNTWPGSSLWEVLSRLDCSHFQWSRALCKLDKGQV